MLTFGRELRRPLELFTDNPTDSEVVSISIYIDNSQAKLNNMHEFKRLQLNQQIVVE